MSITAAELIARVTVQGVDKATEQLMGMGAATDNAGLKLAALGAGGALLAASALAVVGGVALHMAGDFEQSTNTLITSAGLSKNSIDAVRTGILQMSVDTATGTDQLVKGMFNVQSALHLGAGGLQVLKAAAEGAKAENSDLAATTDVLTTAMVNYHIPASMAVATMDSLITTVAAGKMHMNDLTGSLKNVLPVAAAFHIHLSDVEGALATMANAGDRGTSAGTHLAMMFKMLSSPVGAAKKEMAAMGLDSVKLAQTMQTSLPGALKMIQDAVASHFRPGSVEYNRAILAILGGSKSGVAGLELLGQGLKVLGKNTGDAAAALHKGSKDVENWSTIQGSFNFKLDAAKNAVGALFIQLGMKLLPVFGQLLTAITPWIGAITKWISSGQAGAQIGGFFANAFRIIKTVIDAVTPTVLAIAGFMLNYVFPTLQKIGAFLMSTFAPVWKQLQQVWTGQILPALKQLWAALQPLMPVLQAIGGIILAVVVVALGLLVGVIAGVIKGLAGFLSGLATVIGGIVQIFTGVVQVISGIVRFLFDLLTGNFGALKGDLATIWAGIVNIFGGAWNVIKGIFQAAWGAISGLVSGFVQGIIGFFTHLWNMLVGHSIIPDMINGIIRWFASLPGRVFSFVSSLVISVVNFFLALAQQVIARAQQLVTGVVSQIAQLPGRVGGWIATMASTMLGGLSRLAGQALSAGANIVRNIASGIIGSIGSFIGNAMSQVGGFIHDHLPHSPAKLGPLRDLGKQSAMISQMIAEGIAAGSPKIQAAMTGLLKPVTANVGVTGSLSGSVARSVAVGQAPTINVYVQAPDVNMDGVRLSRTLLPHLHRAMLYNL